MSFRSHAEYEFSLIDVPTEVRDATYQALQVLSAQGHSGGSFSIFGGALRRWCKNPQPVENPDSLLKPFWDLAQHWAPEARVGIADYLARISHFEPLTPLTGADDEWCEVAESGDGVKTYQNRRLSRVFKTGNGPAYILDAHVFYEPNSRWDDWVGWTSGGRGSTAEIEFPFDLAKFVVKRTYYTDDTRRFQIPSGIDPHKWIDFMGHQYRSGYDPRTHRIRNRAMFASSPERGLELTQLFFGLMQWARSEKLTVGEALDKLSVQYLDVLDAPPTFECGDRKYSVTPGEIASNLIRLCESVLHKHPVIAANGELYFEGEAHAFSVVPSRVSVPNRQYDKWMHKPNLYRYVLWPTNTEKNPSFFMDNNMEIGGDEDSYLYQTRRQKGLKHPKRRDTRADTGVVAVIAEDSVTCAAEAR